MSNLEIQRSILTLTFVRGSPSIFLHIFLHFLSYIIFLVLMFLKSLSVNPYNFIARAKSIWDVKIIKVLIHFFANISQPMLLSQEKIRWLIPSDIFLGFINNFKNSGQEKIQLITCLRNLKFWGYWWNLSTSTLNWHYLDNFKIIPGILKRRIHIQFQWSSMWHGKRLTEKYLKLLKVKYSFLKISSLKIPDGQEINSNPQTLLCWPWSINEWFTTQTQRKKVSKLQY